MEEERSAALKSRRNRRLQMTGVVIVAAVVIVVVLVVVSSGGGSQNTVKPGTKGATTAAASVQKLLSGISQRGNRLGSPTAKVTVTEYGDLECPVCRIFALGGEDQLISTDVRSGRVKLIYRSLPTASSGAPDGATIFPIQQAAALAAGEQKLGWNYIELFYHEQGQEDTDYVGTKYLSGLARQIPGLNFAKWRSDRFSPTLAAQVVSDERSAQGMGLNSTPTIIVTGPKSQTRPASGPLTYGDLEAMVKSVS